jgi:hypothetical protein
VNLFGSFWLETSTSPDGVFADAASAESTVESVLASLLGEPPSATGTVGSDGSALDPNEPHAVIASKMLTGARKRQNLYCAPTPRMIARAE